MDSSLIEIQRRAILDTIRFTGGRDWKVLVLDEGSKKLIDNAVKEDDILKENVTNVEQIEARRPMNKDLDAVYILSPLPHIVDCVMADFERRRYKKSFLVWISNLDPQLRHRIEKSPMARDQIADFRVMNINFFPRESHVAIFRDPWSFPTLFHPACNNLIRPHLDDLAQKIVSICVSLGEYPIVRYYRPKTPIHEASVLCSHLARFVQDQLDEYAKHHDDYPPPSPRPRGVLYILDRSMDIYAPLLHEFTYQAMAHDLLPIKEGDKVTYKTTLNEGQPNEEVKEMEISEHDRIWIDSRHLHMKDLLGKLVDDFNKFRADNPQFNESGATANLNTVKDMIAGLSEFTEGKNAYTLHLNMAQECMRLFQERKLVEVASVEQSLSTGLDEDYRKPKHIADQLVRLLDEDCVGPSERLRLILLYLLYRDGLLPGDIKKLLAHSQLPPQDGEVIYNLDLLGARVEKPLKDLKPKPEPLFPRKVPTQTTEDDTSLSRFQPNLKFLLEEQNKGTLDTTIFPYTRPHLDPDGTIGQDNASQASLRSAKPTWARTRPSAAEPRQRIILFMAGGATFSEARACYEFARISSKDIYLATSHMLTPKLFLRQLGDLSVDKRRLDLPADRPAPKAPAHLFEKPAPQQPPVPPTGGLASMTISSRDAPHRSPNGAAGQPLKPAVLPVASSHKLGKKEKEKDKEKEKEKKKRNFFK
ncbi:Sec1 family superfamily [Histoplasma capsulatum G186AR]|uniref:Sec1 family superfamily n=1 Tax=Ajellomyces capsulatus TaxID=5037 RepID=A0A8H7ZBJ4_AJECA|nr:Sec1 family superfamily [Histoplasma capsulatum]QSS75697.1 Sec1 family superfamily [Histoplasma capsulatum G186AR]